MALFSRKPIDLKTNVSEFILDKPQIEGKLLDVTKSLWFDRGYGVTSWRDEGVDSWHVRIGNLANEDGSLIIEPIRTSEILGFSILSDAKRRQGWKSQLEVSIDQMVQDGKIRLVSSNQAIIYFYHLTLTPERQPAHSPDFISISPDEYSPTRNCICSNEREWETFLGCEVCRRITFSIIQSFYGDFWIEFESAVTRREKSEDPAMFDQAKVGKEIREDVRTSIAHALYLCGRGDKYPNDSSVKTSRLNFLSMVALHRVSRPDYYPLHREEIPEPAIHFLYECERDKLKLLVNQGSITHETASDLEREYWNYLTSHF